MVEREKIFMQLALIVYHGKLWILIKPRLMTSDSHNMVPWVCTLFLSFISLCLELVPCFLFIYLTQVKYYLVKSIGLYIPKWWHFVLLSECGNLWTFCHSNYCKSSSISSNITVSFTKKVPQKVHFLLKIFLSNTYTV